MNECFFLNTVYNSQFNFYYSEASRISCVRCTRVIQTNRSESTKMVMDLSQYFSLVITPSNVIQHNT